MNQWNPKQSPMQGMSGLWGGVGSNLVAGSSGIDATYPDTNILHLEAQNFTPGDSTWTQSTNSNSNYSVVVNYTNSFTKTGSGNTQRIVFPNSGPTYFRAENVQVPVGIQIICAWAENAPFIIEQSNGSSNANSAPGFYMYGDNSFIYGCYRSTWTSGTGTGRRDLNGTGSDWFPSDGTFRVGGFVMSPNSDCTNGNKATTSQVMVNNTKYTDYTIESGGFPSNSTLTQNVYIGSRNGTSIFLHGGQLAEVWMAPTDSSADYIEIFEANVAAMVTKYGL